MSYFVHIPLDFFRNFSLISSIVNGIHEYSNKIVFVSDHKIR